MHGIVNVRRNQPIKMIVTIMAASFSGIWLLAAVMHRIAGNFIAAAAWGVGSCFLICAAKAARSLPLGPLGHHDRFLDGVLGFATLGFASSAWMLPGMAWMSAAAAFFAVFMVSRTYSRTR